MNISKLAISPFLIAFFTLANIPSALSKAEKSLGLGGAYFSVGMTESTSTTGTPISIDNAASTEIWEITSRNTSLPDSSVLFNFNPRLSKNGPTNSGSGVSLAVGYDFTEGRGFLFGVELSARGSITPYRTITNITSNTPNTPFPVKVTSGNGYNPQPGVANSVFSTAPDSGALVSMDHKMEYEFQEKVAGDARFRIGYQLGRLAFYGTVGAGESQFADKLTVDDTGTQWCQGANIRTDYTAQNRSDTFIISCINTRNGNRLIWRGSKNVPEVLVGLGVEYDFARWFVHGDAEVHHAFLWETNNGYANSRFQSGITSLITQLSIGFHL